MILWNASFATFSMAIPYLHVSNSYTTDHRCGMHSIGLPHFRDEEKAGRYHQNGGLFVSQGYDCKDKKRGGNHYLIYFDTCSCLKVMKDFMHAYIRTSCIKFQNAKQVFPKHRIPFYLAIAEHSMCHPGLPWPQGESQKGSPGLTPFHRAKSRAFFFRLSFGRSVIFGSGTIFPYLP